MPTGLETWNPDTGEQIISITTRLVKELGVTTIGGANTAQSGSITDSRFAWGKPFYFAIGGTFQGVYAPKITIGTDNVLRWSYPSADGSQAYMRPTMTMMYGIY